MSFICRLQPAAVRKCMGGKDGMISRVRENPVLKEVIYLDFRSEIGAFEKHFISLKAAWRREEAF